MDFYFDEPSTSQFSTGQEETQMGDTREESPEKMSLKENNEQQSSSRINDISNRAQELVENINDRRTKDQSEIESFQENLMDKVMEMCRQMKEHMFTVYEHNSEEMQVKLQELSEVLENCTKLNRGLMEAGQALACLNDGLVINQSPE